MYCGGGAGEDRERVVITHPPVTRNEQALRSKFLVTATALDLELTEDGRDMGRCEREVRWSGVEMPPPGGAGPVLGHAQARRYLGALQTLNDRGRTPPSP